MAMEMNLAQASADALSDFAAVEASPEVPSTPAPSTAAVTPTPAAQPSGTPQTPVEPIPAVEPTPAEVKAAKEFVLKYKGQDLRKSEEDVVKLAQMGFDYTQKSQTLSQQAKALQERETQIQQQAAELEAVLTNPEKLKQLVAWAASQQGVQADDPNTVLTVDQANKMVQEQIAQAQKTILAQAQKDRVRTQFELETSRLEAEFRAEFSQNLSKLKEQFPILSEDPHLEEDLRRYGAAFHESKLRTEGALANVTKEDVFQAISAEATRRAEKEQTRIDNLIKAHLAKQAQVTAKGIEPSGGSTPVTPAPKAPKLGSQELRDQVIADLMAARE